MFGEIIYDNFLFDIPKILDLCVLFGKGNNQLLHKMIGEMLKKVHFKRNWLLKTNFCTNKIVLYSCTEGSSQFMCETYLTDSFDSLSHKSSTTFHT